MKKIWPLVCFGIIFVGSFFIWRSFFAHQLVASSITAPVTQVFPSTVPTPNAVLEEVFDEPATLIIPKLEVNASSESVGMDDQGRMDVPQNVVNVAWYNLGVKPGQKGNAVFAGHFDKPDGSPSVFNQLNSMEKGDTIEVVDLKGKKKEFIVTEKRVVKLSEFPLQEVFGDTTKARVNLITCGGKWDKEKKEYSERTIVFSELKID